MFMGKEEKRGRNFVRSMINTKDFTVSVRVFDKILNSVERIC